jgi:hypothetical protein
MALRAEEAKRRAENTDDESTSIRRRRRSGVKRSSKKTKRGGNDEEIPWDFDTPLQKVKEAKVKPAKRELADKQQKNGIFGI